jgi:hypothetical protein
VLRQARRPTQVISGNLHDDVVSVDSRLVRPEDDQAGAVTLLSDFLGMVAATKLQLGGSTRRKRMRDVPILVQSGVALRRCGCNA